MFYFLIMLAHWIRFHIIVPVLDPKKEVCADPVNRGAILGRGEPDPHSRGRVRQLAPDKGSGKT